MPIHGVDRERGARRIVSQHAAPHETSLIVTNQEAPSSTNPYQLLRTE
jgi:hypothetical protein